jgi:AcrR family transcriptional regulator
MTTSFSEKDELSPYSKAKREQIVAGAVKVFLKYGYEGTSMNRVAEEAKVIKQTIYSHFSDKEGLFKAIIESLTLEHMREHFSPYDAVHTTPRERLNHVAQFFMARRQDPSYLALMRTVIGESARFPELARLYTRTVIKQGMALLKSYFEAHPELHLNDPEATTRIFCGSLVNYIISQELLYGDEIIPCDADRVIASLVDMVLKDADPA